MTVSGVYKNAKRRYSSGRGGLLRYEEEQRRDRERKVSEEVTHYHLLTCSVGDIVLTCYCLFSWQQCVSGWVCTKLHCLDVFSPIL